MYSKFKALLEVAERLGTVVRANMYDTFATIEAVTEDGKKVSWSVNVEEEKQNDTV